jgi:hypothetical protein
VKVEKLVALDFLFGIAQLFEECGDEGRITIELLPEDTRGIE